MLLYVALLLFEPVVLLFVVCVDVNASVDGDAGICFGVDCVGAFVGVDVDVVIDVVDCVVVYAFHCVVSWYGVTHCIVVVVSLCVCC